MSMRTPIARRLLEARNDAMRSGHEPIKARISKRDDRELEMWLRTQNRTSDHGIPAPHFDRNNLWGMQVVVDEKVTDTIIFEMAEKKKKR